MRCDVADEELSAFVTYRALGTLEGIRAGTVPASVGILTLGRPIFWEPLENARLVPPDVLTVLKTADELDALRKVAPQQFEVRLTELITQLHMALATMSGATWPVEWATPGE